MNYFEFTDYKLALKEAVKSKKILAGKQFNFDRAASACAVRKTYLSRVLNNEEAHLSEDQLYQICTFLGLTISEVEYLILLRSYQKSSTESLRQHLGKRIREIQQKNIRSDSILKNSDIYRNGDLSEFFLDPEAFLVQFFITVERYAKDPESICKPLNILPEKLREILAKLERLKLIEIRDGRYHVLKNDIHLSSDSPYFSQFRLLQKVSSFQRLLSLPSDKTYNFTAVFSANADARAKIKSRFLAFLDEAKQIADSCPSENVYQLCFDLFDWD